MANNPVNHLETHPITEITRLSCRSAALILSSGAALGARGGILMPTKRSRGVNLEASPDSRKDVRRKNVESGDVGVNRSQETDDSEKKRRTSNSGETELPPNENLNKDPDETYGDTEMPHRHS